MHSISVFICFFHASKLCFFDNYIGNFRDRRSLFPESRRPPPGLDSCVSGHGFCVLPPGSRATLEVVRAESDALLRFLGVSRSLLKDSGEKSRVTTFFILRRADAFVTHQNVQNEQNGAKKRYKSQNPSLGIWITSRLEAGDL